NQYSYLYKHTLEMPAGARTLTLPSNDRVRILAMTLVEHDHNRLHPAAPLHDTLEDHVPDSPSIAGPGHEPGGGFGDAIPVTINHGLYWNQAGIHYTLDGTEPTGDSPVYKGPLMLADSATIKARSFVEPKAAGTIAAVSFKVHDIK